MREPCPNCGRKTLKIELEENRGVCGLCYESLSESFFYRGSTPLKTPNQKVKV